MTPVIRPAPSSGGKREFREVIVIERACVRESAQLACMRAVSPSAGSEHAKLPAKKFSARARVQLLTAPQFRRTWRKTKGIRARPVPCLLDHKTTVFAMSTQLSIGRLYVANH